MSQAEVTACGDAEKIGAEATEGPVRHPAGKSRKDVHGPGQPWGVCVGSAGQGGTQQNRAGSP